VGEINLNSETKSRCTTTFKIRNFLPDTFFQLHFSSHFFCEKNGISASHPATTRSTQFFPSKNHPEKRSVQFPTAKTSDSQSPSTFSFTLHSPSLKNSAPCRRASHSFKYPFFRFPFRAQTGACNFWHLTFSTTDFTQICLESHSRPIAHDFSTHDSPAPTVSMSRVVERLFTSKISTFSPHPTIKIPIPIIKIRFIAQNFTKKIDAVHKIPKIHPNSLLKMKKDDKKSAIGKHALHKKDTGSAPVQIAILTRKITALTDHLKNHPKDKHSRRGLIGMVGNRRKLLRYLQMYDSKKYTEITNSLGLRK